MSSSNVTSPSTADRLAKIIKAYDVRGVVPDDFDRGLASAIGSAFGQFLKEDDPEATKVLIGRDMRPSGVGLVQAFSDAVRAQGFDVVNLGLISTDMLYFASGSLDAPGAVFTASHNPAQYNGIKMCRRAAAPIGESTGLATIRELAATEIGATGMGELTDLDLLDGFVDHVLTFIDTSALKPLKIIADTANGMGGLVVPAVFERLPFDVEIMYVELDGTFPNHPADPINPENLRDLQARVLETGADIGLAFDGDADRVFIVDENAEPVSGSLTTAMVASSILDKNPGATVLHNLICSKTVPEVIAEKGGTSMRTRVGHSFIKEQMAETGAVFAGEHSGHYYFADNYRADSGLITSVVVLEMMSRAGVPLSEMMRPFRRYSASGEINTTVADQQAVIDAVEAAYPDASTDRLDGLTVDNGEWWFNLRPSNTEPLLRLNLEARTDDDVAARVAEVQAIMGEV